MHADEGALRSGVAVATIIRSISFGSSPAEAIASSPALAARSEVYSSGSAMRRSRTPNVSTIHSGEVGRLATTSSLVKILAGTYEPVDLMQTLSQRLFPLLIPPPVVERSSLFGGESNSASSFFCRWPSPFAPGLHSGIWEIDPQQASRVRASAGRYRCCLRRRLSDSHRSV